MRKCFVVLFAIVFVLTACSSTKAKVKIDYGKSDIYTKSDMDSAIELIEETFATWEGCELHSISYKSDECNSAENIYWMNELEDGKTEYNQCIAFYSDFHSPKFGGGAWNGDYEYTDWGWWLARTDGGEWKLITFGY